MIVLGISGALNHDAAISLVKDGKILYASHSERYSKIKNDPLLSSAMIEEALVLGTPDIIAWAEKPYLKKTRQLYAGQYASAMSINDVPSIYLRSFEQLKGIPIHYSSHHYSHAASGFFTSGFSDACVVVIDSIGEWETITIWQGSDKEIVKLYSQSYPHSAGLFYSAITDRVGLKPQEDEYILMGMAAYGDVSRKVDGIPLYRKMFRDFGIHFYRNGKIVDFTTNFHRGCKNWLPELTAHQDHFDIAAAAQLVYEIILTNVIRHSKQLSSSKNLVLSGGTALNCVANSLITTEYDKTWIFPNPGDSGSCIGVTQQFMDCPINWQTPYLGHDIKGEYPIDAVMTSLLKGEICGIANGRAEFGPRALGNRTLTADPRGNNIKDTLNVIKQRQEFRPFAPMILEEFVSDFFELPINVHTSPYMQFVVKCKHPMDFPAIVHQDGTSRVQTVNKQQHPMLHRLLTEFYNETGCPMLVNTSLNIKGMPIVNDINDAKKFSEKYNISVHTGDTTNV